MAQGTLYTVSAPSGAGKTRLVKAMVASDPLLTLSVSHTTRPPRPGEVDGQDYHFVDRAVFERMIAAGEFLEHAEVFGHLYGTARGPVEAALAEGRDVILEIDWQGAAQVRARRPDVVSLFVLPPSLEALAARLRGRAQDDEAVIARRLAAARDELAHWREAHYVVVNDDFDTALADALAVVRAGRLRTERQAERQAERLRALLGEPAAGL